MRDISYSELETVFASMRILFSKNSIVVKKRKVRSRGKNSTSAAVNVPTKYIGSDCVVVIFDSPFKEKREIEVEEIIDPVDEVSTEIVSEVDKISSEEKIINSFNEKLKNENL